MSGEAEVLESGRPPRSRARVAALLALLIVLAAAFVGIDRAFHARGAEQVAACREQGSSTIAAAFGRLTARTSLVRPTVFAMPAGERRQQLLELVSEAVAGAEDRLREARSRCEEVNLLWHHGDLARRRDECVAALERLTVWFGEVARDGAHAFSGGVDGGRACR